jgi:hypothetical protein
VTRLERRARLLLRAYPAGYRRDRGQEIAGTLLEATPAGRDWPLPRESGALIMAGLRARAAANGRLGTQAGLRLAALLGTAVYLALWAALNTADGWQEAPLVLLTAAAVAAGWLEGRIAVKAIMAAAAAAALLIYALASGGSLVWVLLPMACLAVFAGLAAGPRPPRAWLWMPAAVAATGPALGGLAMALATGRSYLDLLSDGTGVALLAVLAASVLWLAVDARPVIGVLAAVSLGGLGIAASIPHVSVRSLLPVLALWLLAPAVLAAPALWRLHRQAAQPGRTAL